MIEPWVPVFYEADGFGVSEWTNLITGFGGVLIGALIGGLISWLLQRSANTYARGTADIERAARKRAELLKLSFRTSYMLADVAGTENGITGALAEAKARGVPDDYLWTRIGPVPGVAERQSIVTDELLPLVDTNRNELVAQYCEVVMEHHNLITLTNLYNEKRFALTAELSAVKTPSGSLYTPLTRDGQGQFMGRFVELDSAAAMIRTKLEMLRPKLKAVLTDIHVAGREICGTSFPSLRWLGENQEL